MITRQEIEKIIQEAPLRHLFSDKEIEGIIEELYFRYSKFFCNDYGESGNKNVYLKQQRQYENFE